MTAGQIDTSELRAISGRLEKLERENRRLRRFVGGVAGVALLVGMGPLEGDK